MHPTRRHVRSPAARLALRPGFSLVELLVALLVINVGLLALAGTTIVLVRQRTELRERAAAIRNASARLEWLGAGPCRATSGSMSSTAPRLSETWSAVLGPNATRELIDSVSFGLGGAHRLVIRTQLPC